MKIVNCDILVQLSRRGADMMKFISQNSSENLRNSPNVFHVARLMTRLIGVRPAVDLSWKALVYKKPQNKWRS